jgi:predicted RNA-binding protein
MCQTSVVMEQGGSEELLLENVTALEVIDNGLAITTLFEGQKDFPGVAIRRIDFNDGKVFLYKTAA